MKRIAICADGTWNWPDQKDRGRRKPSNVVKIARGIVPRGSDGVPQLIYYHEGVGTHWGLDKIAGGGFGLGLSANIVQAYHFIVLNYEPGDDLFLFGFSRGAYTVRSLAGLLNSIGILPKNHDFFTPEGYALYRARASTDEVEAFRKKNHARCGPVKFIGVWDTVGALGVPMGLFHGFNRKYEFHDVSLTPNIEHAYHALAIDERRRPFLPSLWELPEGSAQTLRQVWFPGVHTNVGGGYANDGLANNAMHWIKQSAQRHGMEFDDDFLEPYRACPGGELRDSLTLAYRVLIPAWREIGGKNRGKEALHSSALQRFDGNYDYRPPNLARAIRAGTIPIEETPSPADPHEGPREQTPPNAR
jgi:uncharacterized protein (DUF2235 family)